MGWVFVKSILSYLLFPWKLNSAKTERMSSFSSLSICILSLSFPLSFSLWWMIMIVTRGWDWTEPLFVREKLGIEKNLVISSLLTENWHFLYRWGSCAHGQLNSTKKIFNYWCTNEKDLEPNCTASYTCLMRLKHIICSKLSTIFQHRLFSNYLPSPLFGILVSITNFRPNYVKK